MYEQRITKQLKTQELRKNGNFEKILKLSTDIAQFPVSISKTKIRRKHRKTEQKQLLHFP